MSDAVLPDNTFILAAACIASTVLASMSALAGGDYQTKASRCELSAIVRSNEISPRFDVESQVIRDIERFKTYLNLAFQTKNKDLQREYIQMSASYLNGSMLLITQIFGVIDERKLSSEDIIRPIPGDEMNKEFTNNLGILQNKALQQTMALAVSSLNIDKTRIYTEYKQCNNNQFYASILQYISVFFTFISVGCVMMMEFRDRKNKPRKTSNRRKKDA